MRINFRSLGIFSLAILFGLSVGYKAQAYLLTFEGIPNLTDVSDYYGGGGPDNYGLVFSSFFRAGVDSDDGGTLPFANEPSSKTVAYLPTGAPQASFSMVSSSGFTHGFGFYYSSRGSATVSIWAEKVDGTGVGCLAGACLPSPPPPISPTPAYEGSGDPTGLAEFSAWRPFYYAFSGVAKYVVINAPRGQMLFDNMVVGNPSSLALLAGGWILLCCQWLKYGRFFRVPRVVGGFKDERVSRW